MTRLDDDDLRFFRTTANELNNLLTELSGYMDVMDSILRKSGEDQRLIPMMTDTLERASTLAGSIQKHVYRKDGHEEAADFAIKPAAPRKQAPDPPGHSENIQRKPGSILGLDPPEPETENLSNNSIDTAALKAENRVDHSEKRQPETPGQEPPEADPDDPAELGAREQTGSGPARIHPGNTASSQEGSAAEPAPSSPAPAQHASNLMASSRNIDSALMGKQEQILVVDDEKNILLLVEMMLRSANYRMLKAHDGEEALALFADQAEQIDLVILDFTMQGMDGQELFERMIELKPDARILISSGYAEAGALKEMMAQGLRGYIPKPYSRDRLLYQIKSVLEG